MKWIVLLTLALFCAGCGGGDSVCEGKVVRILPDDCPSKQPSYKADIAPIFAQYCVTCHRTGGKASKLPYTSYAGVTAETDDVQDQVSECDMPPPMNPQPTIAERVTILEWLECGAKND